MAQINTGLKRVFTIFNIFFAVVGGVILGLALVSQVLTNIQGGENLEGRTTGLIVLYVVGAVTMAIAILGAYGAHRESKGALIAFLVCMVIGTLLMLRVGVPSAIARPELRGVLASKFREFLPLDQTKEDVKSMADALQTQAHCCGLFSYTDWENNIPDSCLCNQLGEDECKTVTYNSFYTQSKSVYAQTCFPIILHYVLLVVDIMIGVTVTLGILALFGVILSSVMIHQMRHPNRPAIFLSVPTLFAPPPKYQELHNPPAY
ncbi:tetraspanin-8-like [Embiotoca jacksoni]|uniref:tetraspanin-8-like n=1 Tax=Embiotoca jacksoni TaxID=100190 RepID=UPI003703D28C